MKKKPSDMIKENSTKCKGCDNLNSILNGVWEKISIEELSQEDNILRSKSMGCIASLIEDNKAILTKNPNNNEIAKLIHLTMVTLASVIRNPNNEEREIMYKIINALANRNKIKTENLTTMH